MDDVGLRLCKHCGLQSITMFAAIIKRGKPSYRCIKCRRISGLRSRNKYREKRNAEQRIRRAMNPEKYAHANELWRKAHIEERKRYNKQRHEYNKRTVLCHYSPDELRCACPGCAENDIRFLCLDHIEGGGRQHRISIKCRGISFYRWIIRNRFPAGYRVLCHNCNHALGSYGKCPHQNS